MIGTATRRRRVALALALGLAALLAAAGWVLLRARGRAEEALSRASAPPFATPLRFAPGRAPGEAPAGVFALTASGEAYDAAEEGGRLHVATAGGLLSYEAGEGAAPRLRTHLDGLPGVALRALLGGGSGNGVLIGDDRGGLGLLTAGQAQAAQIGPEGGEAAGPVLDLCEHEGARYLLVRQRGLLRLEGEQLIDEGGRSGLGGALRQATALCVGAAGLFVGTEGGAIYRRRGGRLEPAGEAAGPLTALSCAGEELLVGTATGLLRRPPGGALGLAAPDLLVTSILEEGPADVLVATLDDGVLRLRREGERLVPRGHLLPGRRIHRLRPGSAGPLALGAGIFRIGPGGAQPLPPATASLSGAHVTALGRDGAGRLWIGTFEQGIDVLEPGTFPGPAPRLLHRPAQPEPRADNVNAILHRPGTGEMLVATAGGIDIYGPTASTPRRIGPAEGLLGEQVQALLLTPAGLFAATGRGLSLLPAAGPPRALTAFHGLLSNRLYALAAAGDTIYVGTLAGLSIVEGGRPAGGHGAAALGAGWVSALARCGADLYIGTYGGGLSVLRAGAAAPARLPGGRLHVSPGALLCDGDGVWIGTQEAGLLRWDPGAPGLREIDPRLLPAPVTAIYKEEGAAPLLFVGTEAGLIVLAAPDGALRPRSAL